MADKERSSKRKRAEEEENKASDETKKSEEPTKETQTKKDVESEKETTNDNANNANNTNANEDATQAEDEEHNEDEEALREQQQRFLAQFLRHVFYERAAAQTNAELVNNLKKSGTFKSERVEKVLLTIPREYFLPPDLKDEAYIDAPVRLAKMGFNMSAPHMYAICLENLEIQPGNKILDIGSGTGHFTALAGWLTGPTGFAHGLDIHKYIIEFAEENLRKFTAATGIELNNVKFFLRNCFLPSVDDIKYDRIHVGACCPQSHLQFLYDLLAPGGILVTPYGDRLLKATKSKDGTIKEETLMQVRYGDLVLPSEAEIKEAKREVQRAKAKKIEVPPSSILEELAALVNNPKLSDFAFIVDGKKIYVHKFVLSFRSEHFQKMFSSGMVESKATEMTITDFNYDTFLEFVKFLYTDNCTITADNCMQLLELSNYYKVDRLKALCEHRLSLDIEVENAASILMIADRFNAPQLKSYALEFIYSNVQDVVKTKAFQELDRDLVSTILIHSVAKDRQ
jgi:protein-L-isoaspartate(D-aspartate) O-methyltransferase